MPPLPMGPLPSLDPVQSLWQLINLILQLHWVAGTQMEARGYPSLAYQSISWMGLLPAVPTHKHMAICHLQFVAPHTSLAPPLPEAGVRRGGGSPIASLHNKQLHIHELPCLATCQHSSLTHRYPTNNHTSNPISPETQPFSLATEGCVMHKRADITKSECLKDSCWLCCF